MKKKSFEVLKGMLKQDFDEVVIGLFFLFLFWYLFLNSKRVLAVVTIMIFTLTLIIYRKYFKKIKKNTITKENKKYYEFLGKVLYLSILLSFFIVYSINLFRIIRWSKEMSIALFYPRLILLIIIVFLLLWLFYLLKKGKFKRNLLFSVISFILIYETLILFAVYKIYEIKPPDSEIGFYLMTLFMVMLCLWMIWADAKYDKNPKNETQSKILSKK